MAPLTTATAANPPKLCPSFTGLPVELRLQIYKLAIQDTIKDFLRSPNRMMHVLLYRRKAYRGGLALLHTNRMVRAESARDMLLVVEAELVSRKAYVDDLESRWAEAVYSDWQGYYSLGNAPSMSELSDASSEVCVLKDLKFMVGRCLSKHADGKT